MVAGFEPGMIESRVHTPFIEPLCHLTPKTPQKSKAGDAEVGQMSRWRAYWFLGKN